jgi:hypothetical protein
MTQKKSEAKKSGKKQNAAPSLSPAIQESVRLGVEKILAPKADSASHSAPDAVTSTQDPVMVAGQAGEKHMQTLNFKTLDKRQRNAIYTGAAVSIRIPVGAFPSKQPPQTLDVEGLAGQREKRAAETPEQRKARLAAMPKPTLAEKIAKREASLAALRAKAEKEAAGAQQAQPQGELQPAL